MISTEQNYSDVITIGELMLNGSDKENAEELDLATPVSCKKILSDYTTDLCITKPILDPNIMFENLLQRSLTPLNAVRDYVSDYQEKRGVPKEQTFTFFNLIFTIVQYISQAVIAVAIMMYNLLPLLDAFLLTVRFLVDKLIEIVTAETMDSRIIKFVVFLLEFAALSFITCFTFCLIVMPLLTISASVFYKSLRILY